MDNSTTDNGAAIESEMVFVFNYKIPGFEKNWRYLRLWFNPGCEAKVQVACTNTYTYQHLIWKEVGDVIDGFVEYRFPPDSRSRFVFMRIYESSKNSQFVYYGSEIQAEIQTVE